MIKRPVYFWASMLLLLALLVYAGERIVFLARAERTIGTVVDITSTNDRCGSSRRSSSRYDCTRFRAIVDFAAKNGSEHQLNISAGQSRGHDRPIERAKVKVGDEVPVVYDPNNPAKCYKNNFSSVWAGPIMIFITQICAFFLSMVKPRERKGLLGS